MTGRHHIRDFFSPLRALTFSAPLRLAALVSAIFVVATLVAGAISFFVLADQLRTQLQKDARQMAENLAATYQVAGLPELHAQIATNVATTRGGENLYLFMDNSKNAVFGNFVIDKPFTGPRDLSGGKDIILPYAKGNGIGQHFVAFGLRLPAGWIITARDTRAIAATQRILMGAIGWGLGVAMFASVALAFVLARRTERRIAKLNRLLDDVAQGNLSARFHDVRPRSDDIGRVAASLNTMLDRLSMTVDSLRQISNDVAHDLRTPLTRLRNRLEPLLSQKDLPESAAQELELAVGEVEAIVKTFNAVLRIAQIEGGNARPRTESVDLNDLCSTVYEMLDPVAEEMGHALEVSLSEHPAIVEGDRDMLAQAVVNLVENAFTHTQEPAHITLEVEVKDGRACLRVSDNGPGIPPDERELVFRRFYRLEKNRSKQGSGLGLSLVAAIARLHGGRVELADNNPGLTASICFSTI